jgi:glutaredoxin
MISGRIIGALIGAALAASFASQAQTNVYRWVDKEGNVHFSDGPPPPEIKESTVKRMGGDATADPQLPFATQLAMKKYPATLYVSNDCGEPCASARALLARRGIPFAERNAQTSREAASEVTKLVGGPQVPVLLLGQKTVKGFEEESWNNELDAAGYPRSAIPGQNLPAAPAPSR